MSVEIVQVPGAAVPIIWPRTVELLAEPIALSRGCYEPEDVLTFCVSGDMCLWLAIDGEDVLAAYVVEIVRYPRKQRLRTVFAGAKPHTLEKWFEPMVAALDEFSKRCGCHGMEAAGRRGWSKFIDGEEVASFFVRDYPAQQELH